MPRQSIQKILIAKSKLSKLAKICLFFMEKMVYHAFTSKAFSAWYIESLKDPVVLVHVNYLSLSYKTRHHCSHLMRNRHLNTNTLWRESQD